MYIDDEIREIGAEAFLGLLYPELAQSWVAYDKGLFYRNYSRDILSFNPDEKTVTLSRNGWLRCLPSEMISPETELIEAGGSVSKGRRKSIQAKDAEIRKRLQLLQESFVPFDSMVFRNKINLEHQVERILSQKVPYILKEYFDFDMETEENEYVRKAALLLPYIVRIRGNVNFVIKAIAALTGHKVHHRYSTYGESDNTRCATKKVFIDVVIDGLSSEAYESEMKKLAPLFDFVQERFIPLDLMCDINIKGCNREHTLLDYNYCLKEL